MMLRGLGVAAWIAVLGIRSDRSVVITARVTIAQFQFAPAEVDVLVGDSVVWVNTDQLRHTTTSDSSAWSSPELGAGERFGWRAKQAGRFPYHCSAHPVMHGVVVVHR